MALTAQEMQFSKTISLGTEDNRFQLIYATHLYGTLFGLFSRFQTAEEDGTLIIKQIDFYGINYKGPINLGINKIDINDDDSDLLRIDLKLQADDTEIHTREINKKGLNIPISANQSLLVERELLPMQGDTTLPDEVRAFKNGKFDSEFFERDGLFVKKKGVDPNTEFREMQPIGINVSTPGAEETPLGIGVICRIGVARFLLD